MNTDDRYLERFVVAPSIRLFGGIEVKEDTEFRVENNDGSVIQRLEKGILYTFISKEETTSYKGEEVKVNYSQTIEQNIPIGTILIWSEETGYILPEYKMLRVDEAINSLEEIRMVISDEPKGNEGEGANPN